MGSERPWLREIGLERAPLPGLMQLTVPSVHARRSRGGAEGGWARTSLPVSAAALTVEGLGFHAALPALSAEAELEPASRAPLTHDTRTNTIDAALAPRALKATIECYLGARPPAPVGGTSQD